MTEIKVILSDFDGVVVNKFTELSAQDFCSKYAKPKLAVADFKRVSADAAKELDIGLKSEKEFYNELVNELKLKISADELHSYLIKANQRNIERDEQFCEWLNKMSARGIEIDMVTNVSNGLAKQLNDAGFYNIFHKRYFSHIVGYPKSDERFWRYVLSDLALKPQNILFIDDRQTNIDAARAVAIHSFLYHNFAQFEKDVSSLID